MTNRLKWEKLEDTSSNTVSDDEFDEALEETSAEYDDVFKALAETSHGAWDNVDAEEYVRELRAE